MGEPLVSVLVPAYKAEAFIGPCLRSVLDQTYPNLEVVVVDDCSPDATLEVAAEVMRDCPRGRVLRNERNIGNRENFRRLLRMASGPLVKFVCNDDLLAPDAVARLVGALGADPAVTLATSPRQPIDTTGALLPAGVLPQPALATDGVLDGMTAGNHLLRSMANWIGEPTTVLFRRESLPADDPYRLGTYTPERNLDVVWWLQILRRGSLAVVADTLSSFRIHTGQVTQQQSRGALVLSWHDIVLGARQLGYLSEPADEVAAWLSFVRMLDANADGFQPADVQRVSDIAPHVAARLSELCPA